MKAHLKALTYPKGPMQKVLPYCDIIVGNSDEAATLAKNFEFNTTELHDMIRMLADLPKVNEKRKRIVLITQQEDPVLVYSGWRKVTLAIFYCLGEIGPSGYELPAFLIMIIQIPR